MFLNSDVDPKCICTLCNRENETHLLDSNTWYRERLRVRGIVDGYWCSLTWADLGLSPRMNGPRILYPPLLACYNPYGSEY